MWSSFIRMKVASGSVLLKLFRSPSSIWYRSYFSSLGSKSLRICRTAFFRGLSLGFSNSWASSFCAASSSFSLFHSEDSPSSRRSFPWCSRSSWSSAASMLANRACTFSCNFNLFLLTALPHTKV